MACKGCIILAQACIACLPFRFKNRFLSSGEDATVGTSLDDMSLISFNFMRLSGWLQRTYP